MHVLLKYSGTSVLVVNLFQNSWWVPKLTSTKQTTSDEAFSRVRRRRTHISSSECNESQVLSKRRVLKPFLLFFFLVKMRQVQGLMSSEANEYRGVTYLFIASLQLVYKIHRGRDFSLFCSLLYPRFQNHAWHIVAFWKYLLNEWKQALNTSFCWWWWGNKTNHSWILNKGQMPSNSFHPFVCSLHLRVRVWLFPRKLSVPIKFFWKYAVGRGIIHLLKAPISSDVCVKLGLRWCDLHRGQKEGSREQGVG